MAVFTSDWTSGWSNYGSAGSSWGGDPAAGGSAWGGASAASGKGGGKSGGKGGGKGDGKGGKGAGMAALGNGSWPLWGGGGAGGAARGGGAGPGTNFAANYNVPDLPKAQIEGLPKNGVVVYRGDPERLVDLCEALRVELDQYGFGECVFDNIDVSQVQSQSLSFSLLMELLQEKGTSTKRLKAFKCSLDDDAIRAIAQWFQALPAEGLPSEVHLSHNNITQAGFDELFSVLETKRSTLSDPVPPVWFRVESSQVPASYLHELAAEGKIQFVQRIGMRTIGDAVIAMPSYASGPESRDPGQQLGAAQAAARSAPRPVAAAGHGSWQESSSSSWTWPSGGCQAQTAQKLPAAFQAQKSQGAAAQAQPAVSRMLAPTGGAGKIVPVNKSPWAKTDATTGKVGTTAGATALRPDRSRTPVPKAGKVPMKPKPPLLPPGWEEHWSDEYQLPYYWHRETGESMWEAPK